MTTSIKLIVGLANPGAEYAHTRHNAGAWFVEQLAQLANTSLKFENKFKGSCVQTTFNGNKCHLLIPSTFMNLSGDSIISLASFFKILPEEILIAHDELDLPVGTVRLKFDGGTGGHNGLQDIIKKMHTKLFYRLRIGIGHPGHSTQVVNYVLSKPSISDRLMIDNAISNATLVMDQIVSGKLQEAMKILHTT